MTDVKNLKRALLLTCLLLTGVRCKKEAVFLYHRLGDDTVLPCTKLNSSNCSLVTWTSYKGGTVEYTQEVSGGMVKADSVKASRMSLTSSCGLSLRDLREGDANSYACLRQETIITEVYLSLLTITSPSTITDLQPGRNLILKCVLFTFYDAGNCKSFSSSFNLGWMAEDGTRLHDSRYKLIVHNHCSVTLVTQLRQEDNNRRWRCQILLLSRLLHIPAGCPDCSGCSYLPISRIVLCVALPVMVLIVGFFTWKGDRKRAKTSAAGIELREIH
ncbi:hypothetical protein GBF38_011830 [Nibea albiflora]|uniref:Uncharacterized protein n=1 Tax=Nibea albiflora TaxID=240163 RepID=A0ACB7EIV2_NIBAL|nr:hypothetical protein GBF38_011830 [Nibea albiflora]